MNRPQIGERHVAAVRRRSCGLTAAIMLSLRAVLIAAGRIWGAPLLFHFPGA
jgi:hypothetical protein